MQDVEKDVAFSRFPSPENIVNRLSSSIDPLLRVRIPTIVSQYVYNFFFFSFFVMLVDSCMVVLSSFLTRLSTCSSSVPFVDFFDIAYSFYR